MVVPLVTVGQECEIVGAKTSIGVMTVGLDERWVKKELEPLFVVQKAGKREPVIDMLPDFCPIVFNPANQIIHPATYWGLFRNWRGLPLAGKDKPSEWLYRGMDEVAGQCLAVLDEELQGLKDAYYAATGSKGCLEVIPLADRLVAQYGDQIEDQSSIAKMVGTNKAYSMAKTPVIRTNQGVMPNPNHRVVLDDIGWGLCVLISIAERLESAGIKCPTTMTRAMVEWHQSIWAKTQRKNLPLSSRDSWGQAIGIHSKHRQRENEKHATSSSVEGAFRREQTHKFRTRKLRLHRSISSSVVFVAVTSLSSFYLAPTTHLSSWPEHRAARPSHG